MEQTFARQKIIGTYFENFYIDDRAFEQFSLILVDLRTPKELITF